MDHGAPLLEEPRISAVFQAEGSVIAGEAIRRIAGLYAVEKEGRGRPPEERVRLRQAHAKPILDDLGNWLHAQLPRISGKSELAKAIRYALARMRKLRPYLRGHASADPRAGPTVGASVRRHVGGLSRCSPRVDQRSTGARPGRTLADRRH